MMPMFDGHLKLIHDGDWEIFTHRDLGDWMQIKVHRKTNQIAFKIDNRFKSEVWHLTCVLMLVSDVLHRQAHFFPISKEDTNE